MDWQQFFNNFGVLAGFCAFILFWLSILMWMMVDAQKRGLWGWVWAFVGLLTGPVGLIGYILFWRGRYAVLPVVEVRDALIRQTSENKRAADQLEPEIPPFEPTSQPDMPLVPPPIPRQYQ